MWGYKEYETVADKKEKAKKALEKLRKKDPNIAPVVIEGSKIAKSWWGIAWNKNLESYSDYYNRIDRGRSYVKNGYVLDLKIDSESIVAIVAGSRQKPYKVNIVIDALSKSKWEKIIKLCGRNIDNIDQLVQGKFPKDLETLFTQQGEGLFPSPNEINFDCDCPDFAYMCKHVAAVLYAVGARLDEDPSLFFKLRNIEIEALIKKSIEEKMQTMLKSSKNKTNRIIDDANINDLFGL
jgi:uncharacterized Zn finger protein